MNAKLTQRLAAIEAATAPAEDFILRRVIFVGPNEPGEVHSCTLVGHPGRFIRQPDETEDAFMERVHDYARTNRRPDESAAIALIPAEAAPGQRRD